MTRPGSRGAAMAELVLALPILCLMIFGGLMMGYYLYVKLALTWYVHAESEKYALQPPLMGLAYTGKDNLPERNGPRPRGLRAGRFHAHTFAIPLPGQPLVFSAACYRMPVPLPAIRLRGAPASAGDGLPDSDLLARLQRYVDLAHRYAGQTGRILDQAEQAVDEVEFVRQFVVLLKSPRQDARLQAARLVGSWIAEAGLEQGLCGGDGNGWVVTATAMAWSEKTGVME